MKWTSGIWVEHCREQDEAFIAELKKVDDLLRKQLPLERRVWLKFLDFLDWLDRFV